MLKHAKGYLKNKIPLDGSIKARSPNKGRIRIAPRIDTTQLECDYEFSMAHHPFSSMYSKADDRMSNRREFTFIQCDVVGESFQN